MPSRLMVATDLARGAGVFLVGVLLGLLVSFFVERASDERVARAITMDGQLIADSSRDELLALLDQKQGELEKAEVRLRHQEQLLSWSAAELGLSIAQEEFVERALCRGRCEAVHVQFGFWFARLFSPHEMKWGLSIDEAKLRSSLESGLSQTLPQPQQPSIAFRGGLIFDPGRSGLVVDYPALKEALSRASLSAFKQPVELVLRKEEPQVSREQLDKRHAQAKRLVSDRMKMVYGESVHWLSADTLGRALSSQVHDGDLELNLSEELLREGMGAALGEVELPSADARFSFDSAGRLSIEPSEPGRTLDGKKLMERIWAAAVDGSRTVEVPVVVVEPNLSTAEAEALGVSGIVSSFTTRHPCCQPRVTNIHRAADLLDGIVLRPGERFSLNERLGQRRASSGYVAAPTIVHGEMEKVLGGGISQLATTLFNAALRGGYEIVQRQPHSIYFPRYPEGHEATVSYPEPDLVFRNDTAAGVVIEMHYTDHFIKVTLYGDNAGRKVAVKKSKRYDIVKPPKEYQADEARAPDEPKRIRAGQLGWTVLVSREITFPDGKKKLEKREVVYQPRAELFLVHPCMIPEEEPGHTGEECPEAPREEREEVLSDDTYYETTDYDVQRPPLEVQGEGG